MNCASPGAAVKAVASDARTSRRLFMGGCLPQQDAGTPDLLRRDHAEEVRQDAIHQLEVRGQGRDLLVLAVDAFFRELFLVQVRRPLRRGPEGLTPRADEHTTAL